MVLSNNVLCFLAGACKKSDNLVGFSPLGMKDINGVIFRMRMFSGTSNNNMNVSAFNNTAQVGKGTTPANNNDFQIENPFTNGGGAPEDNPVTSISASYENGSQLIKMITSFVALGIGSITEVCKFVICNDENGVDRICLVARDIISPVGFINGSIINIEHEVST